MRKVRAAISAAIVISAMAACIFRIAGTMAGYVTETSSHHRSGAAGYGMDIKVEDTDAAVVQNSACSYGKIISLDNRSQTTLMYNIVVKLEDRESWPEGLKVVLLTDDGEKTDGEIHGKTCVFSDTSWCLFPGERASDAYGLKIETTYDTDPGEYHFMISSATYQLD